MSNIVSTVFVFLLCICLTSYAAANSGEEHPYLTASQSLSTSAEVVSIDLQSRMVELRSENGQVLPYKIAESTRNLDQVEVGDVVDYQFESRVSLILVNQDDPLPENMDKITRTRAEPGEKPQMTTETKRIQTARVVSIDLESSAFQLEWSDGSIESYTTEETEMLKKASVGDHLVKTQTERLVIAVSRKGQE